VIRIKQLHSSKENYTPEEPLDTGSAVGPVFRRGLSPTPSSSQPSLSFNFRARAKLKKMVTLT